MKPFQQQINEGDTCKHGIHNVEHRLASEPETAGGLVVRPRHVSGQARTARNHWSELGETSPVSRPVDLTQVPTVPWAWVDEHVYAAIRGCSVKVLQNERRLNIGCPFRRINGTMIRYKMGDIAAFLDSQPGGGGASKPMNPPSRRRGRPRKSLT